MKEYFVNTVLDFGKFRGNTVFEVVKLYDISKVEYKKYSLDTELIKLQYELNLSKFKRGIGIEPKKIKKFSRLQNIENNTNHIEYYLKKREDFYISVTTLEELKANSEYFRLTSEMIKISMKKSLYL